MGLFSTQASGEHTSINLTIVRNNQQWLQIKLERIEKHIYTRCQHQLKQALPSLRLATMRRFSSHQNLWERDTQTKCATRCPMPSSMPISNRTPTQRSPARPSPRPA